MQGHFGFVNNRRCLSFDDFSKAPMSAWSANEVEKEYFVVTMIQPEFGL